MNDRLVLAALLRTDLSAFVRKSFQTVLPGTPYLPNWHIDAIVYQLMQVRAGAVSRLLINQPPRSLKSICVSVAYVAWLLGHDPARPIIVVSYSNEFAAELHRQFRMVVDADWYRGLFPAMRVARDTGSEFVTTAGGGRYATSVGGTLTGRGADLIIVDDPLKAEDAMSDVARKRVNDWYGGTLVSRLNDKERGPIIVVMQRLHEDDLAGHLLRQSGWHHLDLPAIAVDDQVIAIGHGRTRTRRVGDILHPERESREALDRIKAEIGSLMFSAQYQQRPVPPDGNLVRRSWIKWYATAPDRALGAEVVQSWDIATTTGDKRDWSVCTTWQLIKRDYYLLDVWRGRFEFPQLRRKLIALAIHHRPNRILIEKAGPGLQLIQELRANPMAGVAIPFGIIPEGTKVVRMELQCARFEAGQVYLPREAPWLSEFLHEILAFPNGRHDDQIDSLSQFLKWAESSHQRSFVLGHRPKAFKDGELWFDHTGMTALSDEEE
jgi:predicted phage terminase large subunit-like protein